MTPDGGAAAPISREALECIGLCDVPGAATIDDVPVIRLKRVLRAVDELLEPQAEHGLG